MDETTIESVYCLKSQITELKFDIWVSSSSLMACIGEYSLLLSSKLEMITTVFILGLSAMCLIKDKVLIIII